ncbi:MAG: CrcB family protein [Bdellovibrionaceae bacterium]|nr:CrcB family protein [Pseudobdellovibrionaceae bacterium]
MNWILFVSLSALGAGLRWGFALLSHRYMDHFPIPLGTLLANGFGAFLIGWLYIQYTHGKTSLPAQVYIISIVAFLGSLTTFSSFALETIKLFQNGQWTWGSLNIFLNNVISLGLCYIGIKAG